MTTVWDGTQLERLDIKCQRVNTHYRQWGDVGAYLIVCREWPNWPSKLFQWGCSDDAIYSIVNIQTGDLAAQLSDIDRIEIITTNKQANNCSQVIPQFERYSEVNQN